MCHKPIEGMNPEIRVDGQLVCSNDCFRAIIATEGEHEFDIYWQNPDVPSDAPADETASTLRSSFRVRPPVVPTEQPNKPPAWLTERLRVEQIVVGCSPLAQRVFSLVADLITVSRDEVCLVSTRTLARTLRVNHVAVIEARDELVDAGALNVHPSPNPHNRRRRRTALTLACRTRPIGPEERRETIRELLTRVRAENGP